MKMMPKFDHVDKDEEAGGRDWTTHPHLEQEVLVSTSKLPIIKSVCRLVSAEGAGGTSSNSFLRHATNDQMRYLPRGWSWLSLLLGSPLGPTLACATRYKSRMNSSVNHSTTGQHIFEPWLLRNTLQGVGGEQIFRICNALLSVLSRVRSVDTACRFVHGVSKRGPLVSRRKKFFNTKLGLWKEALELVITSKAAYDVHRSRVGHRSPQRQEPLQEFFVHHGCAQGLLKGVVCSGNISAHDWTTPFSQAPSVRQSYSSFPGRAWPQKASLGACDKQHGDVLRLGRTRSKERGNCLS